MSKELERHFAKILGVELPKNIDEVATTILSSGAVRDLKKIRQDYEESRRRTAGFKKQD